MDEIRTPLLVDVDPSRNLDDLLAERVRALPDASLVERRSADGTGWSAMSVRAFDTAVVAAAQGLVARGVQPGDLTPKLGVRRTAVLEDSAPEVDALHAAGPVPSEGTPA